MDRVLRVSLLLLCTVLLNSGCGDDDATDDTPPGVLSTVPVDGGQAPLTAEIRIIWSELMDTEVGTVTLSPSTSCSMSWEDEDRTLVLTPDAPLQADTQYTVTLATDFRDQAGNAPTEEHRFSFTARDEPDPCLVDETPPTVISTPEAPIRLPNSLTTVDVLLVFSEEVTGVTASSVTVDAGASLVITGSGSEYLVTVAALAPNQTHTVALGAGITDLCGNSLTAVTLPITLIPYDSCDEDAVAPVFTSSPASQTTLPAGTTAVDVALIFSEPVTGVSTTTVTATNGASVSSATGGGNSFVASLTGLSDDQSYELQIGSGIVDGCGNELIPRAVTLSVGAPDPCTGDTTAPTLGVSPIPPINLPSGTTSANITFTFSEDVWFTGEFDQMYIDNGATLLTSGTGVEYTVTVENLADSASYSLVLTSMIFDLCGNPFAGTTIPIQVAGVPAQGESCANSLALNDTGITNIPAIGGATLDVLSDPLVSCLNGFTGLTDSVLHFTMQGSNNRAWITFDKTSFECDVAVLVDSCASPTTVGCIAGGGQTTLTLVANNLIPSQTYTLLLAGCYDVNTWPDPAFSYVEIVQNVNQALPLTHNGSGVAVFTDTLSNSSTPSLPHGPIAYTNDEDPFLFDPSDPSVRRIQVSGASALGLQGTYVVEPAYDYFVVRDPSGTPYFRETGSGSFSVYLTGDTAYVGVLSDGSFSTPEGFAGYTVTAVSYD